jgi:hypothetical protein
MSHQQLVALVVEVQARGLPRQSMWQTLVPAVQPDRVIAVATEIMIITTQVEVVERAHPL